MRHLQAVPDGFRGESLSVYDGAAELAKAIREVAERMPFGESRVRALKQADYWEVTAGCRPVDLSPPRSLVELSQKVEEGREKEGVSE
jgi:hypothetical protein